MSIENQLIACFNLVIAGILLILVFKIGTKILYSIFKKIEKDVIFNIFFPFLLMLVYFLFSKVVLYLPQVS